MGIFDIFKTARPNYGTYDIGPVPTPNPPQNVSYTPQQSGSTLNQYAGPAFGPQYTPPKTTSTSGPGGAYPKNTTNLQSVTTGNNYSFGNPSSPDLSNPIKQTDYNNYLNQATGPSEADILAAYQEQQRQQIESGYNDYFNQLDQIMSTSLPGMQTARQQQVNSAYDQFGNDLNLQQTQGLQNLGQETVKAETNQNKNLKNMSENLRNMFMAGNVYLGSRGAGDSSAANQYSYALTKMGNKNRGDVMSQTAQIKADIAARETQLKQTVDNEKLRLDRERSSKIGEISDWYNSKLMELQTAKANGAISKSTDLQNLSKDLLNAAMQKLSQVETTSNNLKTALDTWAMNNSTTIGQLKTNLASLTAPGYNLPAGQMMSGSPTVDAQGNYTLGGFGNYSGTDETNKLYNLFR
jgi:hypothetical protein